MIIIVLFILFIVAVLMGMGVIGSIGVGFMGMKTIMAVLFKWPPSCLGWIMMIAAATCFPPLFSVLLVIWIVSLFYGSAKL